MSWPKTGHLNRYPTLPSALNPPKHIVEQRVRNRLIEYLEMIVDIEVRPPTLKTSDVCDIWEDWVHYPITRDYFPKPIYADEEIDALLEFSDAFLSFCDASKPWPESYAVLTAKNYWAPFVSVANKTLNILAIRGRLPEK